jgi:hypothetical protein
MSCDESVESRNEFVKVAAFPTMMDHGVTVRADDCQVSHWCAPRLSLRQGLSVMDVSKAPPDLTIHFEKIESTAANFANEVTIVFA